MSKTQPHSDQIKQAKDIQRLDKYISNQKNELSRTMVKELIKKKRVTINDIVAKSPDCKVDCNSDIVCIDNQRIGYKKFIYLMLNKPQGVVCSTRDGLSPTVLSLIPEEFNKKGLFPAGRLDKDTEGFVLMTNDGDLAHRMLSPKNHVPKTYFVRLKEKYKKEYENRFLQGIVLLSGEKCLPASIYIDEDCKTDFECKVVISQGMFHQVKKMFEALGNEVVYLKRLQIGQLKLDENLQLGQCREILHKNVSKLLETKR